MSSLFYSAVHSILHSKILQPDMNSIERLQHNSSSFNMICWAEYKIYTELSMKEAVIEYKPKSNRTARVANESWWRKKPARGFDFERCKLIFKLYEMIFCILCVCVQGVWGCNRLGSYCIDDGCCCSGGRIGSWCNRTMPYWFRSRWWDGQWEARP